MARRLRDPRLLVVFALGAVLRLYQLGHESLWTDELITLDFVTRWSGLELLVNLPSAQPHLPVYYLVLDAWVAVAGTSALALRLPSAVFGIAALPAMYAVVSRAVDHEAGIVATLLLAVSRFHVRFSQEVRMYSLLVLLALLSVSLLQRVRANPTRRNLAGFAAVTVLLVYTHVFAVFVVVAEGLYVAYRLLTADEAVFRPWAVAFTPVALSLVPFVAAAMLLMGGTGVSLSYVPPPTVERALKMVSTYAGYGFGTTWLVHLVLIPAFLGAAVLGLLRYRLAGFDPTAPVASLRDGLDLRVRAAEADTSVLFGALFVVPFGLPIVLSYAVTPIFWPRYTIAASLGLFALVARGVRHVEFDWLRYGMAGLLVLAMVPSLGIYYTGDQKEQWREVGATIDERAESGDVVLVADQITERGAHHYVDRDDVRIEGVVVADSGTGQGTTENATIREYQRGADGVWLVFSHAGEAERDRIRTIVADGRERTFHRQYEGVEVYRYEATGDGTESESGSASSPAALGGSWRPA